MGVCPSVCVRRKTFGAPESLVGFRGTRARICDWDRIAEKNFWGPQKFFSVAMKSGMTASVYLVNFKINFGDLAEVALIWPESIWFLSSSSSFRNRNDWERLWLASLKKMDDFCDHSISGIRNSWEPFHSNMLESRRGIRNLNFGSGALLLSTWHLTSSCCQGIHNSMENILLEVIVRSLSKGLFCTMFFCWWLSGWPL